MSKNRRTLAIISVGAVVIFAVAWGLIGRRDAVASLRVTAAQTAVPPVQVVYPQQGAPTHTLDLPGNVVAWYEAPIYAQVSGYVKMWYVDYGAKVKKGQLLATIDAPELDQQYQAAQAQLAVAQTKYRIASLTAKRYGALSGTQAVSQQQVDVEIADAAAGLAQVQAAQDDVARYAALEGFKQVVAPFSGVVTSRQTDVGDYVSAAGGDVGSGGKSTELFSVADIHEMRVFVDVPQDDASSLQNGLTASVELPQFPNRIFTARFATTAGAFNPVSRTVTTELTIDNPHDTIWPGSYADVRLAVKSNPNLLIIPEQALLFRAQGLQVAVVKPDNSVHLQDVKLGLNLGSSVQVLSGLSAADRIIDNPSDGLLDGQHVQIVPGAPGVALNGQASPAASGDTQMATRN
jgi:RND family efflux transporter MFP subunit